MFELRAAAILLLLLGPATAAEVLHDPMRPFAPPTPGGKSGKTAGGYALSAILYSPDRRVAIVNGKPVSEGDRIGAARVSRIARTRVELVLDGKTLKLALNRPGQTK